MRKFLEFLQNSSDISVDQSDVIKEDGEGDGRHVNETSPADTIQHEMRNIMEKRV